ATRPNPPITGAETHVRATAPKAKAPAARLTHNDDAAGGPGQVPRIGAAARQRFQPGALLHDHELPRLCVLGATAPAPRLQDVLYGLAAQRFRAKRADGT